MDSCTKEILKASEKEEIENKIKNSFQENYIETFENKEDALIKELKKYGYDN